MDGTVREQMEHKTTMRALSPSVFQCVSILCRESMASVFLTDGTSICTEEIEPDRLRLRNSVENLVNFRNETPCADSQLQ